MSSVKLFDGRPASLNGGEITQAGGNLGIHWTEKAFMNCPIVVLTQIIVETTRKFQMLPILAKTVCSLRLFLTLAYPRRLDSRFAPVLLACVSEIGCKPLPTVEIAMLCK